VSADFSAAGIAGSPLAAPSSLDGAAGSSVSAAWITVGGVPTGTAAADHPARLVIAALIWNGGDTAVTRASG
jgi:hypothetical protein